MNSIFSNSWIAKLETLLTPSITKWQEKALTADVISNTTASDLTFNNLTIGRTYRVSSQLKFEWAAGGAQCEVLIKNGSTIIGKDGHNPNATISKWWIHGNSIKFIADSTTLTFDVIATSTGYLAGDNTKSESFVQLEELPEHEVTTDWT